MKTSRSFNKVSSIALLICFVLSTACSATNSTQRLRPDLDPSEEITLRGYYPYRGPLPDFSTPVTLKELRLAYYRYSPKLIMEALRDDDSRENWDFILDNIANGDKDWIDAISYFNAGLYGHGSASLELNQALVTAMSKNPEAVLWLEAGKPGVSLEYLCNGTINLNDHTGELASEYTRKTIKAMQQVSNPHLIESRDTCIRRMEDDIKRWDQMKDEECTH